MNKAPKNNSIGLAGGVLTAAGLCIGILSLGNKKRHVTKPAPIRTADEGEPEFSRLVVEQEPEIRSASEKSVIEEPESPKPVREEQGTPVAIADLAHKGESAAAIAQALGISVGEVQLRLRLQQLSTAGGRK